ncbi:MAG: HepT-like ribonuclease domain-containing protein [Senegalimassilia faecalis]
MSVKENDLLRIQEMYDIATQTMSQIAELEFNQERFVHAQSVQDQLIAEGLANRVFRITEEGGKLSELFKEYGFELREMSGLRNRLAHAYGTIDMEIVRNVLETEFPKVIEGCERYCDDNGITLNITWS